MFYTSYPTISTSPSSQPRLLAAASTWWKYHEANIWLSHLANFQESSKGICEGLKSRCERPFLQSFWIVNAICIISSPWSLIWDSESCTQLSFVYMSAERSDNYNLHRYLHYLNYFLPANHERICHSIQQLSANLSFGQSKGHNRPQATHATRIMMRSLKGAIMIGKVLYILPTQALNNLSSCPRLLRTSISTSGRIIM